MIVLLRIFIIVITLSCLIAEYYLNCYLGRGIVEIIVSSHSDNNKMVLKSLVF